MTDAPKPPALQPPRVGSLSSAPPPAGGVVTVPPVAGQGTVPPPAKVDPYVGKTIDGRYLIERMIGEGGMGVVYAARHKVIGKRVAIKVLRGEMATDHEANERFLQEARSASAIGNPHIVDISDFGQLPDGSTYFVMELLGGKSLSAFLTDGKGPVPVPRLCHIAKQIAQGLAAAHAANIVHRDLKPDNVMLVNRGVEKDFVKILDFGIAKVGSSTKKMTRAGSVFGTPHYMSPEQAAGATVDHRTDIYALGVILYEMASGKVPFDADNFMGILTQHMYKAPVPIRALVPEVDVPAGLDAIVLKCLTKKPEGRYADMEQLAADLDKLEKGLMPDAVQEMMARSGAFSVPADYFRVSGMPAPVPATPGEKKKRWPVYAVAAAAASIACVVGAILLARTASSTAEPLQPSAAAHSAVIPESIASRPASPGVSSDPAPLPTREVLVNVAPAGATLTRDGRELGEAPIALHLAVGETASLVVMHAGYKAKTVTIDGKEPRQLITLEPAPSRPSKAPGNAAPKTTGGGSVGGMDDVGDPFAKGR
jgi:eukaryotic-like serine/threonine-protein kinase